MSREIKLYSPFALVLLIATFAGTVVRPQDQQQQQDQSQQKEQEQKKKKKGGFFGGLKSVTGQSSEQQEVTATAGSKTVGEGEQISSVTPKAEDRRQVSAMENYSLPPADVKKFQEEGKLQPKK